MYHLLTITTHYYILVSCMCAHMKSHPQHPLSMVPNANKMSALMQNGSSLRTYDHVVANKLLIAINPIYKLFLKIDFLGQHDILFPQLYAPAQSKDNHEKIDVKWECHMEPIDVIIKHINAAHWVHIMCYHIMDCDKSDACLWVINCMQHYF